MAALGKAGAGVLIALAEDFQELPGDPFGP
jgi:hypothetical protein